MTGKQVSIIEGVHMIAAPAIPFVRALGDGRVAPALGAVIIDIGGGKFLASVFNGQRRVRQVLEIFEFNGMPTLGAAPN
jgi:hypothetical protein